MGYNFVTKGLAQGSYPGAVPEGFDVVVLCAMEKQELEASPLDVLVVKCPLDDGPPPTMAEVRRAKAAAHYVVKELKRGRRVLVTCFRGWNRSGLVTGLALRMMGLSGKQAVDVIRLARGPDALSNTHFVGLIHQGVGA